MIPNLKERLEELKPKKKKKEENNKQDVKNQSPDKPIGEIVYVDPQEIKLHPEISKMFEIEDEILEKTINSMKQKGYDKSQPLVCFYIGDDLFLAEGHTRIIASINAGIFKVPIEIKDFSLEEAADYCFDRQDGRRQTSQWQLLQAAMNSNVKTTRDGSGRSVEKISKKYHVSTSFVINARYIGKNASKEDLQKIKEGKAKINQIYTKLKTQEKQKKENEAKSDMMPDVETRVESLEQPIQDEKNNIINNKRKEKKEKNDVRNKINKIEDNLSENILRLLVEEKEEKEVSLIITKFRYLFTTSLLKELSL